MLDVKSNIYLILATSKLFSSSKLMFYKQILFGITNSITASK